MALRTVLIRPDGCLAWASNDAVEALPGEFDIGRPGGLIERPQQRLQPGAV